MSSLTRYFESIAAVLEKVARTQEQNMIRAAELITQTIIAGGMVHIFGTGHSHILAEECFYRAGGIVPVNAMLEESLMLHTGALQSSRIERLEGYAKIIMDKYDISNEDTIIIVSNSGKNAVPVEMALEAKKRGLTVIALTSLAQSIESEPSHPSGKRLFDLADVILDNCGVFGDALMEIDGFPGKVGPTSTITGAAILHGIMYLAVKELMARGITPPIFMSGNIPGGDEHNEKLLKKYRLRMRHL
ncbi:MAG: SIS domain-containing protein [Firmicutes bacterium]|nr:SIS domain-containing protein [Bacillota bacterium]